MNKKIHRIPLLAAALTTLVVGGSIAVYMLYWVPADTILTALPSIQNNRSTTTLPALPLRLRIPALRIDARVQQVGRTVAGLMANPNNFYDVGWYVEGTWPGQKGSAVIAGHVDNALGLDGIFKHLNNLAVGDDVYVDTTGETLHFRVMRTMIYSYDDVPVDELFTKTDGIYLNLVTCGGAWLSKQRTYDHRLVVYTQLAG